MCKYTSRYRYRHALLVNHQLTACLYALKAHEAKGFKAVGRPRKSGGKEEEEDENDEEEEEEEEALGVKGKGKGEKRSKGGARGGGGVSETQAKKAKTGAAPPPRSRLRMTDEDLIQQAILASMHDS